MSAQRSSQLAVSRAEIAFREAFDRLKCGRPTRLPKRSKPSQNNVAKEAGVDPSALRKTRFPELVAEIQQWVDQHPGDSPPSARQALVAQRRNRRNLRQRNESLKEQRDIALGLLTEADARILELTMENQRLRALSPASTVTGLGGRGSRS